MTRVGRDRNIDTDGQWARSVEQRLNAMERPDTMRIGEWVVSSRDGELVATTPGRPPVSITAALTGAAAATGTGRIYRVVQLLGSPTSGTWGLVYRGSPTVNTLSRTATAAAVLQALLDLDSTYTALDFNVTGANGGPWTLAIPAGSLSGDATLLGGGTNPSVDIQPL